MRHLAKTVEKGESMKKAGVVRAAFVVLCGMSFAAATFAGPDDAPIKRGHEVYDKWCFPCHGTGAGKPGTASLAARGQKPAVLEERTDLTPTVIKGFVRHGVLFMPTFRKTEISDADLDAIAAYLTRKNSHNP
jgi:mono/diheme cytochrome c family protein